MPSRTVSAEDPMYDFQSIEIDCGGGNVFDGVKEIKYSVELSRKLVYGTKRKPKGKTGGQLKPSASITFYKKEFDRFLKDVLGGNGYGLKDFTVTVKWSVPGEDIITDVISGCSLTKPSTGGSNGEDAIEVSCDLMPTNVLMHGFDMVDDDVQTAA